MHGMQLFLKNIAKIKNIQPCSNSHCSSRRWI